MRSEKPFKLTLMQIALLFIMMGLPLLASCGHVKLKDEQFCAPIIAGGENLGATCDNLLTENQKILLPDAWTVLQESWLKSEQAVECTNSNTLGDIKAEIEKLCSVAPCDYPTQQKLTEGLAKLQRLGRTIPRVAQ